MSFAPHMPSPIAVPHLQSNPGGGPLGHSVASVFHGLHSGAMAPKMGHHMAPGPAPRTAGAPMPLMTSGRPVAQGGHLPAFGGMAASANPQPARGFMGPTG